MKTYKANKYGPVLYIILGVFIYLLVLYFLSQDAFFDNPYLFVPFISPIALGLWVYLGTFYRIKEGKLMYRSAFFKGEVDVSTIREIIIGKSVWNEAGMKPALSADGMVIWYNRFDDVFIAPENKEELIADLLELNGNIKVTEKKPG